jgi:AcrR family transcriptional regulator
VPIREIAPRGRHAPPLQVRKDRQRRRLFGAASAVFARAGYADATAEAIAREAGMSKATFYEHFDNKEDCIIRLFDVSAEAVIVGMRNAASVPGDPGMRYRAAIADFLGALAAFPNESRTLLVEIIGAGPKAIERRDRILATFAGFIDDTNKADAAAASSRASPRPRTPSPSWARWPSSPPASCARGTRRTSRRSNR